YIEVATGTYDYNTSIRNAIQRMAENGITGATYKRGEKIVKCSLEATVRRDTLTAVHKLANQSSDVMCEEIGTDYVEISSHLGARVHPINKIANHAGWQGKVFKIHGEDPEYPNLKESTGYPDDILGLGGVNCRHRMFPFVPGISTPNPINFSEEENRKAYELSQQQRKLEREMRKLKKKKAAAKASGDKETEKKLREKIKLKSDEIDKFCEDNKLTRDYNRELVTEQISKKVAKAENDGIIDVEIDELVPCLRDTSTGKLVETEVSEIARKSLEKYTTENGWIINWADRPKEEHIFGVFVKGDNNPQGLVSLRYERGGTYVALAVNAPQNNKLIVGDSIKYKGVGGHLFAVAVEESIKNSGYGTIYGYASNKTVLEHYIEQFGAKHLPIRHRYQFLIEGKDSEKLLKTYNYERRV
ncbi:MAG: phage minor capsid protein, partial [Acutalibacteraceae bacterium]|nr:phage minor capsid protein [Acutalibacteraceae bacterium]